MIFDPMYFLILAPAMLLGAWAQWKVKAAYARGKQEACRSEREWGPGCGADSGSQRSA